MLAGASGETAGMVFNLGSNEVVSLKDLAQILVGLEEIASVDFVPFPSDRHAIDIGDYFGNFTKISEKLWWAPHVGSREGVKRTVSYYWDRAINYWD